MAKAPTRRFNYQPRTAEDVKARANMKGGQYDSYLKDNFPVYKAKEGKNLIRILPPTWDGAKHYGLDIWVNFSVGVDNQSYLSLFKMKNKKDPLAEAKKQAERAGDEDLAKQLTPKLRTLWWLIDRLEEDKGPQLWAGPYTIDKDVANLCFDEDTGELLMIDDPENGNDLRFYREGTGRGTKYPASKIRLLPASALHADPGRAQAWLDFIEANPLPSCLRYYDYDHIANVFNGGGKSPEDEEEQQTAKPRLGAQTSHSQAMAGNGAAADSDDDDEEPAPAPRQRPRNAAPPADEDDEPAPPPRTGQRRAAAPPPAEEEADEPPPTTARRRPAAVEAEPEDEAEPEADPEPTPRAPRARRPAFEPEDESADEETVVSQPAPRGRRAAAAPEADPDEALSGDAIRQRLQARRATSRSQ